MPGSIGRSVRELLMGRPGRRFVRFFEARQRRRAGGSSGKRALRISVGILLLIVGLAIGWLPGPGGFLGVVGAALLSTELRPVARLLDRAECAARSARERLRRWRRRHSAGARL